MVFFKKNRSVECTSRLLFEILSDDLKDGLCTDVIFTIDGKKHRFGAWGDNGETRKSVIFYLDEYEFSDYEQLKSEGTLDGKNFYNSNMTITVTECNGCYPESTPRLLALMNK